jgi:PAS domain S-box-containing protein
MVIAKKESSIMKKKGSIAKPKGKRFVSAERSPDFTFLRKLIDTIPVPVFYKDIRGVYLGINRAFREFLGRGAADIVGKTVYDVAPKDLADIYHRADTDLYRSGGIQVYESDILHADGTRRHCVFSKAVFLDREGRAAGLIGSIFDITERKRTEEEIRKGAERYRRIFESIQDVYYEVSLDGIIREISPSVEKNFSYRREDFIGRSMYDFYVDPDRRKDFLKEIQEKGRVDDFEIQLTDGQGSLFTCSITAAILPAEEEGGQPRIVGCLRNITRRKHVEDALKLREEELSIKSQNLEDLNTALRVLLKQREEDRRELEERVLSNVKTAILPHIEKLKSGAITRDQRNCLGIIETQIREIVSPFLHKISQQYFDLTPQEIQVADLVREGRSSKEISGLLSISTRTVDCHRNSIRKKLGIKLRQTNLRSFLMRLS